MYHAGHTKTQLRAHVWIIAIVVATARMVAHRSLIRSVLMPLKTPQMAGTRKRSRQTLGRDDSRNLAKQNKHGRQDAAMLTQSVRRESEPTTKPPVADQATNKNAWLISCQNPMRESMKC
jgi:hypothetical protein